MKSGHMTHTTVDHSNDLIYHNMSMSRENEINIGTRAMNKTAYYNHPVQYQTYFPNENGFPPYDSYGQSNPSPTGADYYTHSSCAMQNSHHPSSNNSNEYSQVQSQYHGPDTYANPCLSQQQGLNCTPGLPGPPGTTGSAGGNVQQSKGEIYPWMKESRQNSKQRQQQQQQQHQQTTTAQQQPQQLSGNAFLYD